MKDFKKWLYTEYSNDVPKYIEDTLLNENIPKKWINPASKIYGSLKLPEFTKEYKYLTE